MRDTINLEHTRWFPEVKDNGRGFKLSQVNQLIDRVGSGIFAVQGLLAIIDRGKEVQMPALTVSLAAIALGGAGSFLHLQHWERIFNGFGHLESGITQELIGIIAFGAALVVYFPLFPRDHLHPRLQCVHILLIG